ncbi:autotransporter-associated beta strand repeat-containing protein [Candidatus Paracaedibacter symbiosus]|uniref:autotransporter-associated beta strand repeat-containing protein n=1 Tax=Candidatus Paracaedibacter symbiosus TaxID=244582 RepID=UPI0018DC6C9B|nr:autotransporter-associated beta strand repeat-containing protein [Candidatus Paracaedibacter symbiosus]
MHKITEHCQKQCKNRHSSLMLSKFFVLATLLSYSSLTYAATGLTSFSFISNNNPNTISVINTGTGTVSNTISLGTNNPWGVAFSPQFVTGNYSVASDSQMTTDGIGLNPVYGNSLNFAGGTLTATSSFSSSHPVYLSGGLQLGTLTAPAGGTINTNSNNLTFSQAFSGPGSLTKQGAGTLTLSGVNIYTGGTLVSAGTLQGDTNGIQGNVTNNSAVVFANNTSGSYAGIMGGTGTLTHAGPAALTFTAANTYTGGTTISPSTTLALSGSGSLASTGAVVANGTFDISGITSTSVTIGDLTGSGTVYLGTKGLTFGTNNTTAQTYGGVIQDTSLGGSIIKVGTATAILSGTNNTYTGGTTFNNGILQVGNDASLGDSSGALHFTGGTLQWNAAFNLANTRAITLATTTDTLDTNGNDTTISRYC